MGAARDAGFRGSIAPARGSDVAELGAGKDTFTWDPGDGSEIVEGQDGGDVVDINGSNVGEKIDVSGNGSRVRLTRDVAAITVHMDGAQPDARGGADTITVDDLSGTDLKTAAIDPDVTAVIEKVGICDQIDHTPSRAGGGSGPAR